MPVRFSASTFQHLKGWFHRSDPTSFDIQLVNEHVNPPVVKTIATNVQTSAGSYTFSNVAATVGYGLVPCLFVNVKY